MDAKWDMTGIAAAHFDTLRDAVTGKRRARDYLGLFGFPALVALIAVLAEVRLYDVSKLLGGIGIFTALLFGMVGTVFNLYLRVRRDERLSPYDPLIEDVRELFANVSWSVLVGLALITSMVIAAGTQEPVASGQLPQPLSLFWTAVLTFLFMHLLLSVLVALNRFWLAHLNIDKLPPKS